MQTIHQSVNVESAEIVDVMHKEKNKVLGEPVASAAYTQ